MSNNVVNDPVKTAYGENRVSQLDLITDISAEYGLLTNVFTALDTASSGTATVVDGKFTVQTGTAIDGLAGILTRRTLNYKPGQGSLCRLSAVFSPPSVNSNQIAGLITAENSLVFGYVNDTFGIARAHDGVAEYQELQITRSASGSETASITINGVLYSVPITAGTEQQNAYEIAVSLDLQVSDYHFTSNNDTVSAQSIRAVITGAFAFSSSSALATWTQISVGLPSTIDFVPQTSWNRDTLPALNPLLGNVYQVQYTYLGYGPISFYVQDSKTGEFTLVHVIEYPNTSTLQNMSNPAFRIGWFVQNTGNATNLTVQGGSAAGFIDGDTSVSGLGNASTNDQLNVTTTLTNIITLRNRINMEGKRNRAEIRLRRASLSTQTSRSAFFVFVINPIFSAEIDYQYIDKTTSLAEVSKDFVTITGGRFLGAITLGPDGSDSFSFDEIPMLPGDVLCIAAQVSQNPAADMQASLTWIDEI